MTWPEAFAYVGTAWAGAFTWWAFLRHFQVKWRYEIEALKQ